MKGLSKLPNIVLKIIIRLEKKRKSEFWSDILRTIYKEKYNIEVGYGSYGCFDLEKFPSGTTIGKYCSIADGVHYFNANHPIEYVTTHPAFYNPSLGFTKKDVSRSNLIIGNDVWIGYGVLITSNCHKIGSGAIIGAGSVVTKDVEPYTIVAGNPAKLIKKRFDEEVSNELQDFKWYDMKIEELVKYMDYINDPVKFIQKVKNYENE